MRLRFPLPSFARASRTRPRRFFAWLPRRLASGTIVWLEPVERIPSYQRRRA